MFYYISLFLAVFALSTSAIFVKLADAPPAITAFYRLFFAMLVLLPFLLAQKGLRQELANLSKNSGDWAFYQVYFCPVIMFYGSNH